ncbi:MAG: hypothetical protein R6X19_02465 [Kiritimatiellia bacterium]
MLIWGAVVYGGASGAIFKALYVLVGGTVLAVMVARPNFLLMATVILLASEFRLDFLPYQTGLYVMIGAVFCCSAVAEKILTRGQPVSGDEKKIIFWALGFALVLIVTAGIRGSGLRLLGSYKWGGRPYVLLLFAIAVLFQSLAVKLTGLQCKRMLYGFCLAGLFPSVAAIAIRYGGFDLLTRFVIQSDELLKSAPGLAGEVDPRYRLQIANVGATYMFLLMWLLVYLKGLRGRLLMGGVGVAGLLLTGISGHRISLLYGVVLSTAFILLNVRASLFSRLVNGYTALLTLTLSVLVMVSSQLPVMYQRSLSWLPFVDVSANAQIDAAVTSQWRIMVWKRAFEELPQYLLIGKGFAFSRDEMFSYVNWTMNDYSYVLSVHNYHNGLVHILVDLGLPGILFALGFVAVVYKKHYRLLSANWNSPMLCHFHRVMLAGFAAQVVVYLVVGGNVMTMLTLFFWTIMLMQLARADAASGSSPAAPLKTV